MRRALSADLGRALLLLGHRGVECLVFRLGLGPVGFLVSQPLGLNLNLNMKLHHSFPGLQPAEGSPWGPVISAVSASSGLFLSGAWRSVGMLTQHLRAGSQVSSLFTCTCTGTPGPGGQQRLGQRAGAVRHTEQFSPGLPGQRGTVRAQRGQRRGPRTSLPAGLSPPDRLASSSSVPGLSALPPTPR